MAVVKVTLGNRSSETVDISSVAGGGPSYTVTLASPPSSDTVVGDTLTDEAASPNSYLITAISGSDLTVSDVLGASAAPDASATSTATTIRSYANTSAGIIAAETALDDTTLFADGDIAELLVCDRSTVIGAAVTISGGGGRSVDLSEIRIIGHESYRHDGIYTGASGEAGWYCTNGSAMTVALIRLTTPCPVRISWMVVDVNLTSGTTNACAGVSINHATANLTVDHCIIRGTKWAAAGGASFGGIESTYGNAAGTYRIINNTIYGFANPTTGYGHGITFGNLANNTSEIRGNTIYDCQYWGIARPSDTTGHTVRNNIVMGCGVGDIDTTTTWWGGTTNYNYTSDTSAPGANAYPSEVVADTFVDAANGDFSLKAGSNARGAGGNDTGYAYGDVELDINGDTRPAVAAWDIGADSYVAPAVTAMPASGDLAFTTMLS